MSKKIVCIWLIMVGIFPGVYGQKWFSKKTVKALQEAAPARVSQSASQAIARRASLAEYTAVPKVTFKMQRKTAQQMRPLLFNSSRWDKPPTEGASYMDIGSGVISRGNLTQLSAHQLEVAQAQYQQAMDAMRTLVKYMNRQIFYLGEFGDRLVPEQIRQALADITRVQGLVKQAQVTWGDNAVLKEAALYLQNAQGFYTMLATGSYFEVNVKEVKPVERPDGRTYNYREFDLSNGLYLEGIPTARLTKPSTWFGRNLHQALPEQLRVALLQDDPEVIADVKALQKKAKLKKWKIDYYDDPEYFLDRAPYMQYDLILTDVLMQNGGGRYLTRQLRAYGYEGSIITLSGFNAIQGGEAFFADGVDGMIDAYERPGADWLWARLNDYFYLKKKNGWKH